MDNITSNIIESVRQTAMLADISVTVWQGHGDKGEISEARSAHQAVRVRHYALTLPWTDVQGGRGPRLLPNALFELYLVQLATLERDAKTKRQALPDEEVRAAFRISRDFQPIPCITAWAEQARGLPDKVRDQLITRLERKQEAQIAEATAAMWAEARQRVEHLVERLSVSEAPKKFKSATVESARALVTLLPGWNVTGNPLAVEAAEDLERILTGVEAVELRKDELLRGETARRARKLLDKMQSWGV